MSTYENFPLVRFYPAEICENKDWYVKFYVWNPFRGCMALRRVKVNRVKNIRERRMFARNLAREINAKLEAGWNPFVEQETRKGFHKFLDALDTYMSVQEKEREANSLRCYKSFVKKLTTWLCEVYRRPDLYAYEFDKPLATAFMLWVKQQPKVSHRSYNNHLTFYRALFNWLVQFDYTKVNPFAAIKKNPKNLTKKNRKSFTNEQLRALVDFLKKENPRYLAACMLTYYCFLRPDDLTYLRAASIDLKNSVIKVNAEDTKNDNTSYKTIPLALEPYLECLQLDRCDKNHYVFGHHKKFTPSAKRIDSREVARYWSTVVRKKLSWGMELQFYSLKDTGISNLLADGVGANYVQGQADHSSLEVTNEYVVSRTPEGHEMIRQRARVIE